MLDDAQLLVSEAVTNALTYGGPPLVLRVHCDSGNGLRIDVRDSSRTMPRVHNADPDAEHGRGMALIEQLSDDWGVRPENDGKIVWFRLKSLSERASL